MCRAWRESTMIFNVKKTRVTGWENDHCPHGPFDEGASRGRERKQVREENRDGLVNKHVK